MINPKGINNIKPNPEQNETMANLNPNLTTENEVTNTLTDKPLLPIAIEDQIQDDDYFEEEVKKPI